MIRAPLVARSAVFALLFVHGSLLDGAVAQVAITRVSVDSNGSQGDGDISDFDFDDSPIAISSDGRYVGFASFATNLVANDTNSHQDVFVHDRTTAATVRVSVSSSGAEGDGDSDWVSLSKDGRFVAFESLADNFVANDVWGQSDVFVHDRDPDGNGIFDEGNGVTTLVSVKLNGGVPVYASYQPSISGDGRFVAFASAATGLVAHDANGYADVFLRDVVAAQTSLVSVSSNGTQGNRDSARPAISSDGLFVAFESLASDLAPNDKNQFVDVFVRDLSGQVTTRVSVDSSGNEGDGDSTMATMSGDGGLVAFSSLADDLVAGDTNQSSDVFLHDRTTGVTEIVSVDSDGNEGDGASIMATMSSDGGLVAFASLADDLAPGDNNRSYDVFVRDRSIGRTYFASSQCAMPADLASRAPAISGDGGLIAFASHADNLVQGDTNYYSDAFVFDRSVDLASWTNYGVGFAGTFGIPGLRAGRDPALGTTTSIDVDNSYGQWTVGFLLAGLGQASLPTNLGGSILVDFTAILPLAVPPGGDSLPTDIPFDPALCGVLADFQVVEVDRGAAFGFSFTGGLEFRLGR